MPPQSSLPRQLLKITEVPEHLRFNRYILRGYRPLSDLKGCLCSLFSWHNQSVDLITHAIPFVFVMFLMEEWAPWSEISHQWLATAHSLALTSPFIGSITYHLLMCHQGGEVSYRRLLMFDMIGVWTTQTLGGLPGFYTALRCASWSVQTCVSALYACVSLYALYLAVTGRRPIERMAAFTLLFMCRTVLLLVRCAGYGNQMSIANAAIMDAIGITGGAINALRIPERWMPGKVDYVGNSHQIMHVLAVVAVQKMHETSLLDLRYLTHTHCNNNNKLISTLTATETAANNVTGWS